LVTEKEQAIASSIQQSPGAAGTEKIVVFWKGFGNADYRGCAAQAWRSPMGNENLELEILCSVVNDEMLIAQLTTKGYKT